MKGVNSAGWITKPSRDQVQQAEPDEKRLHPSAYTTPRTAPKPPSFATSFRSVFTRAPVKVPSSTSLRSAYSAASQSSSSFQPSHPYANMVSAPLPVVSSKEDEEDDCPVCLEPLSFSFRLPGEKPHIVPECGHALHEVSRPFSRFYVYLNIS